MRRLLTIFMCLFVCTLYTIATPQKEGTSTKRQPKREVKKEPNAEQKQRGIENAIKILKSGIFAIYTVAPSDVAPVNKERIARCDARRVTHQIVAIQENDKSVIISYDCSVNSSARKCVVELFYKSGFIKAVDYDGRLKFTTYAHVERLE